jgi:hypothetical protein
MSMSPTGASQTGQPSFARSVGGPSPLEAPWDRDMLAHAEHQPPSMQPSRSAPAPPASNHASPNLNRYSQGPALYRPAPASPNTPISQPPPRPTRAGTLPLDSFPTVNSLQNPGQLHASPHLPTPPPMSRAGSSFAHVPQSGFDEEKELPQQPPVKGRERSGTQGKSGKDGKKSVFGFMSGQFFLVAAVD